MSTIGDQITTTATGPASVEGDQGKVVAQPLKDLIEADKYVRNTTASGRSFLPIRFQRFLPGGAV